jgi:MFS family permease
MLGDRRILYITAFLRALATGMMGVLLGIYLARMAFSAAQIGVVISSGLAGAVVVALLVTLAGDRLGRRRLLFWLALLSSLGGVAAAYYSSPMAVGIAAFIGMLNGWLAQRIGLVNTMVFTHIPSSLLLVTVAFAPNFWVAAVLFLLREGLVEMDVPTRQSDVMAVVRPEERTFASGVTHLVRLGGWAVAPSFAGFLMQYLALGTPLFIGAGMKISYDILLYFSFRGIKPPEEK